MYQMIQNVRQLREKLLTDPYRPIYHIVAPEGVCKPFDPNGALFWKGRYHLMYIIQTEQGHCWAHISSKDLMHWRHHPLALEPGGVDTGIFSGGAFVDKDGIPTITYWGLGEEAGICLATSTDDELDHWTKSLHNPVIHQTEHGLAHTADGQPYGAADPSAIWISNGRYYMLTGNLLILQKFGLDENQEKHKGDTAYLFVSDDLAHWKYLHPFYRSNRKWTQEDEDNMCPDFFPLGDRHMLLFISHNLGCQYYLGRYSGDQFLPEQHGRMTWIDNAFFAPESLLDDQGRRIMWAWVRDGREEETQQASGWSGAMSLPRVLWLGSDGSLRLAPPEEITLLRYNPRKIENLSVPNSSDVTLPGISGNSIELSIEMESDAATRFGVAVCRAPDGQEQTLVFYDRVEKKLKIDTTKASLGEGSKTVESGPLDLPPGEPLRLRVFVDHSMVEAFANDRQAITRCVYPTRTDSQSVAFLSHGGETLVKSVEAWDMAATNPC